MCFPRGFTSFESILSRYSTNLFKRRKTSDWCRIIYTIAPNTWLSFTSLNARMCMLRGPTHNRQKLFFLLQSRKILFTYTTRLNSNRLPIVSLSVYCGGPVAMCNVYTKQTQFYCNVGNTACIQQWKNLGLVLFLAMLVRLFGRGSRRVIFRFNVARANRLLEVKRWLRFNRFLFCVCEKKVNN